MREILVLEKQVGETPLQCMDRFRVTNPEYADVKMTYAGRLDPMAEGLLLVLAGESVKRKEEFLGLDKEYICTAILGVETDTYDVLGFPTTSFSHIPVVSATEAKQILNSFLGTFEQQYPPYSSKTVGGVQLHQLAREGKLDGVEMPKRTVTVYGISDVSIAAVSRSETAAEVIRRVSLVTGDFRQEEIITAWRKLEGYEPFCTISFKIRVSGGAYIRSIVHEMGRKLGVGACIIRLKRTKIGDFDAPKA